MTRDLRSPRRLRVGDRHRRADGRDRRARRRQHQRRRLDVESNRGRPVARRRRSARALDQLPGRRLDLGPRLLLPGSSRLRRFGDPVHGGVPRRGRAPSRPTRSHSRPPARTRTSRSWRAAPRSCTTSTSTASASRTCDSRPRRSRRSSRAASRAGTTPRSWRTIHSCALPNLPYVPSCAPTVRVRPHSSRPSWRVRPRRLERVLSAGGGQPQPVPVGVVVARRQRNVAAVLRRRRRIRHRAVQQRRDHVRRVRLRAAARLPGRVGAEQGRLLHATDGANVVDRAARRARSTPTGPRTSTASTRSPTRVPTRCRATAT